MTRVAWYRVTLLSWWGLGPLLVCHRPDGPQASTTTSASTIRPMATSGASAPTAASASATTALVWSIHPAGRLDEDGRLCMPKVTKQGTCTSPLRSEELCALPDCELVAKVPGPELECCFAQRFQSSAGHRCVLAIETEGAVDATGCGSAAKKTACASCAAFVPKETKRVQEVVAKACCYSAS